MIRNVCSLALGVIMIVLVSGCSAGISSGSYGSGVGVGAGVSVGY